MVLNDDQWVAIEREACRRSLANFIKLAWHVIEPTQPYVHGWHIDALAQHLEAVTAGDINRLLINIPPGTMKSLVTGVFWPAWEWGPKARPSNRYVAASHSEDFSIRDTLKMRRLVSSEWYQKRWPIMLSRDQNEKKKFENQSTGFRQAMAMKSLTGTRGDRVLLDDPHSIEGAISEADRTTTLRVFKETVPTRLNNPDKSAIVVVMQRIHEEDVSGLILAEDLGYVHLCLPMEFEPDRRCVTKIGFADPRTEPNELLFPARFSREVVERDKKVMGELAVAGQFQQRPAPRGGLLFKPDQIGVIDAIPASEQIKWTRGWDLASSTDGDWTAGVKCGRLADGRVLVADVLRLRVGPDQRDAAIKNTADMDGRSTTQSIPQDPGQAGKTQALYLTRMLAGHKVKTSPETGDKVTRAEPVAAQVNVGNLVLLRGDWNKTFIDELRSFPNGSFDDQVDALSRAFAELIAPKRSFFG